MPLIFGASRGYIVHFFINAHKSLNNELMSEFNLKMELRNELKVKYNINLQRQKNHLQLRKN